ncbi:MAG: hypothetical protein ABFS86_07775 [Planctomycetota bacterium]
MKTALLLLAVVALAAAAVAEEPAKKPPKESDSAKKARSMLAAADRLAFRPLADGLKDLSLEFEVVTLQGKLRGLWLYRAATKKLPARSKKTVKNVADRRRRRLLVTGILRPFRLITDPVLRRPFADLAADMDLDWNAEKREVRMKVKKGLTKPPTHTRIVVALNAAGLPDRVSWFFPEVDPEDPMEGTYEIERSSSFTWSKVEGKHVVTMLNTNRTGSRLIAKYTYAKVKGILLPKQVDQIDPLGGMEKIPLERIKVNEGISDEEFARW